MRAAYHRRMATGDMATGDMANTGTAATAGAAASTARSVLAYRVAAGLLTAAAALEVTRSGLTLLALNAAVSAVTYLLLPTWVDLPSRAYFRRFSAYAVAHGALVLAFAAYLALR
ncbi:MAG: hypothetical protein QOK43_900 [Acidimicrobiaceae bacterium]|nr:hypothetical protein [Acidimicrobiaceae bacterium]